MSEDNKPRVVCLCGSTRFQDAFDILNAHLSLQGDIVISCGLFGHTDESQGAKFLTSDGNSCKEKTALDELHKRKIDLCDCIYIVNFGGYVGDSTKNEISYAIKHNKGIYFMFPPSDETLCIVRDARNDRFANSKAGQELQASYDAEKNNATHTV